MLHVAELVSYMYITRHFLCSRYYIITFILQILCSVTMKTKGLFMKTKSEFFSFPHFPNKFCSETIKTIYYTKKLTMLL